MFSWTLAITKSSKYGVWTQKSKDLHSWPSMVRRSYWREKQQTLWKASFKTDYDCSEKFCMAIISVSFCFSFIVLHIYNHWIQIVAIYFTVSKLSNWKLFCKKNFPAVFRLTKWSKYLKILNFKLFIRSHQWFLNSVFACSNKFLLIKKYKKMSKEKLGNKFFSFLDRILKYLKLPSNFSSGRQEKKGFLPRVKWKETTFLEGNLFSLEGKLFSFEGKFCNIVNSDNHEAASSSLGRANRFHFFNFTFFLV